MGFIARATPDGQGSALYASQNVTRSIFSNKRTSTFEAMIYRDTGGSFPNPVGLGGFIEDPILIGENNTGFAAAFDDSGGKVAAFDLTTGAPRWFYQTGTPAVQLSTATAGGGVIVATQEFPTIHQLIAFDPNGAPAALLPTTATAATASLSTEVAGMQASSVGSATFAKGSTMASGRLAGPLHPRPFWEGLFDQAPGSLVGRQRLRPRDLPWQMGLLPGPAARRSFAAPAVSSGPTRFAAQRAAAAAADATVIGPSSLSLLSPQFTVVGMFSAVSGQLAKLSVVRDAIAAAAWPQDSGGTSGRADEDQGLVLFAIQDCTSKRTTSTPNQYNYARFPKYDLSKPDFDTKTFNDNPSNKYTVYEILNPYKEPAGCTKDGKYTGMSPCQPADDTKDHHYNLFWDQLRIFDNPAFTNRQRFVYGLKGHRNYNITQIYRIVDPDWKVRYVKFPNPDFNDLRLAPFAEPLIDDQPAWYLAWWDRTEASCDYSYSSPPW